MRKMTKLLATVVAAALLGAGVAGFVTNSDATTSSTAATTAQTATAGASPRDGGGFRGGPGSTGVSVDSVTTEDQLVALIQEAYGEPSLGLHRGHQDVESTLVDVLGISHDEMHVRMDAGQNLAAIADDLGIDQQDLVDALVETRSPAIDALVDDGTITAEAGDQYLAELEAAYEFRVTWDGEAATPTVEAVS